MGYHFSMIVSMNGGSSYDLCKNEKKAYILFSNSGNFRVEPRFNLNKETVSSHLRMGFYSNARELTVFLMKLSKKFMAGLIPIS